MTALLMTALLPTTAPTAATSAPDAPPTPSAPETESGFEENVEEACSGIEDGVTVCRLVTDWTGDEDLGRWAEILFGTPLRIVAVILAGFLVRWLVHKTIDRIADEIAEDRTPSPGRRSARLRSRFTPRSGALLEASPLHAERRVQRARTIQSVLRSLTTGVVYTVVVMLVLSGLGFDLAPLIAGAGIAGVALGFGSQTLVKDFLSGLFMIFEDQYGVGDVVDLGEASGSVEAVALRVTRVRDVNGTVWYVRNGEILRVGNQSQGWARAVIDVQVAYGEDVGTVQDLLFDVGRTLHADPDWAEIILEDPEVWGVEALSADAVIVRLVVKTAPLEQWKVARELRRRIKARFDAEGIEMPFPQRTVWLRQDDGPDDAPTPRSPRPQTDPAHTRVPHGEGEAARDVDLEERAGT